MNESTVNIILGFLGLLTNIVILMAWWVRHSINMAETRKQNAIEVENLRHSHQEKENTKFSSEIEKLKLSVTELNKRLDQFGKDMRASVESLQVAEAKYTETQKKAEAVLVAVKDHVEWTHSKFRQVDSTQQEFEAKLVDFGKVVLKS